MQFICYNGRFLPAALPVLSADNRSFRWGDGLFETMKVFRHSILLGPFHFERLFQGIRLLGINTGEGVDPSRLQELVLTLCEKNHCSELARVRLAVYRTHENTADFLIEAAELPDRVNKWEDRGWSIDFFPFARKAIDAYSHLKTANFLPYVMAERFAREKALDDALVMNSENHIADSCRANVFLIREGELFTPALHQGCINGVVRRHLLEEGKKKGFVIHQDTLTEEDLLDADEVFLTNSILDLRWVRSFRHKNYACEQSRAIYEALFPTFYRAAC